MAGEAGAADYKATDVVYLGAVILAGGKLGVMIAPLDRVKETRPEVIDLIDSPFDSKDAAMSVIGGIYRCEAKVDEKGMVTNYRPSTAVFTEPFPETEACAMWQARDAAVRLRVRSRSREKKLAADSALNRHVDALRFIYRNMGYAHRTPFKVWLLEQLEKGP